MSGVAPLPEPILLTTYTRARKYPKVVGVIMGWVSPWPSTAAQMAVLLGSAIGLLWTRRVWGIVVPSFLQVVMVVGLPIAGWWAVRFWKPEQREPAQAMAGALSYFGRPRLGAVNGRRIRVSRGVAVTQVLFVRTS